MQTVFMTTLNAEELSDLIRKAVTGTERTFTMTEAVQFLGFKSKKTLYNWIKCGKLSPRVNEYGKKYFTLTDLEPYK